MAAVTITVLRQRNSLSGKFRPARMVQRLGRCLNEKLGEIVARAKMRVTRIRTKRPHGALLHLNIGFWGSMQRICLLYTSDAADDMQCVDLGGRRIIKKKKKKLTNRWKKNAASTKTEERRRSQ
eukprot:TRINITY_DN406_c0_g1_i3.p2 TRINITY_DN406_c0_g1~~TRINITY_DN406_c0_g1_i3.p2  ORF type:complete len:124 (+),score=1.61 TRINITY_DN406_c0_g1_i3:77-448(+)